MSNKKLGRPIGVTGQAKVLDEKELKQVLKIVEIGNHSKRNSAIVIISHYLGLRAKEISSLKIGDVYENGSIKKVLRLIAAYTKGSKHRDCLWKIRWSSNHSKNISKNDKKKME